LHPYTIDVLSCQHDGGATALQSTALLYERRERRRAGTLGAIVGRAIDQADRFSDIVIANLDDTRSAPFRIISSAVGSGTRTAFLLSSL
jgi:hypothetical protein